MKLYIKKTVKYCKTLLTQSNIPKKLKNRDPNDLEQRSSYLSL